jgi:hypothetical protein
MLRWAGWLVIGTLVAAAGYEVALALGAGSLGPNPGDGVAGSGVAVANGVLTRLQPPIGRATTSAAVLLVF